GGRTGRGRDGRAQGVGLAGQRGDVALSQGDALVDAEGGARPQVGAVRRHGRGHQQQHRSRYRDRHQRAPHHTPPQVEASLRRRHASTLEDQAPIIRAAPSVRSRSGGHRVPRSRVRQKAAYTPPPTRSPKKRVSPPWVAPLMVGLFLLGIIWLILFYVTNNALPVSALGNWNLLVGFAFIIGGFGRSEERRVG